MIQPASLKYHTHSLVSLAWPLVLTQVGHVLTGIVDNAFLGSLGPTEQAAGVLSNSVYIVVLVFTIGMSYATTPLVTAANGTGDHVKKASLFKNSIFLNLIVAIVCFAVLFFSSPLFRYMGQPVDVVELAIPLFDVLIFSMIPVSFFFTCKQYCEGLGLTRMALLISVAGNLINIVLNYLLIWGKLGFPELGYIGSAWASFIARTFMGASFFIYVFRSPLTSELKDAYKRVVVNLGDLRDLFKIGFNSAMQFTFEVAAFVVAGLMCGRFGKEQLDAHGISMNLAAFTYMFASGVASASTIRTGFYDAQGDWQSVRQVTRASLRIVIIVMSFFGILFLLLRDILPVAFTNEPVVRESSSQLLLIAALFQVFDGLQVTLLGVLRGVQDVKVSTWIALTGYWLISVPLAWLLSTTAKLESEGVWISLLISLIFVAAMLYARVRLLFRRHNV